MGHVSLRWWLGATVHPIEPREPRLRGRGTEADTVGLSERQNRIRLLAFPDEGVRRAAFNRRGTISSRVTGGAWRLNLKAPRLTRFSVEAALSTIPGGLEPCQVRLNGKRLPREAWSHSNETKVLKVQFTGRRVRLAAAC